MSDIVLSESNVNYVYEQVLARLKSEGYVVEKVSEPVADCFEQLVKKLSDDLKKPWFCFFGRKRQYLEKKRDFDLKLRALFKSQKLNIYGIDYKDLYKALKSRDKKKIESFVRLVYDVASNKIAEQVFKAFDIDCDLSFLA